MSNQSGISADEQLLEVLGGATFDGNNVIIITGRISDDNQRVEYQNTYRSLQELESQLNDEPVYIFIKDKSGVEPEKFEFLSYVPDTSNVRSKMLYASTKGTLVRQIGTNSINRQLLVSLPSEIGDSLTEKNVSNEALLTESEKLNLEIGEQQRMMKHSSLLGTRSHQLVSQNNGAPNSLSFQIDTGDVPISELLNQTNFVSFGIENERVKVVMSNSVSTASELQLIVDHPTYTIYRNGSLNYFIYSCPSGSKVKERMLYASNKLGFIKQLQDNDKLSFAKVIEIGDPEELELSLISKASLEDLKAETEEAEQNKKVNKFSRPKGPSRARRS